MDDVLEPVELDAPPIAGVLVELSLVVPPLPESVALPVPVAPIELVPLVGAPEEVSGLVLPVVVLLFEVEPVVGGGEVDDVEELVDGVVDGVVLLVDVLVSCFVHAPSESAPTTARAAAVTWVKVIFIRKLLERFAIGIRERAAATALLRL